MTAGNSSAVRDIRSSTLQLEANVEYELVLKFPQGRSCSTGNVLFTMMDGKQLFLKPEDARKIHELGLAPNEPFKFMKRVVGSGRNSETCYIASRVKQQPEPSSKSFPAAAAQTEQFANQSTVQPSLGNRSILGQEMASAYLAAIDALLIAQDYAEAHGIDFRVNDVAIGSTAHSIFIEYGKTKDRSIREREFEARYGGVACRK